MGSGNCIGPSSLTVTWVHWQARFADSDVIWGGRLVNLQSVLQDTRESARKVEEGLDRGIEVDETALLVSHISFDASHLIILIC